MTILLALLAFTAQAGIIALLFYQKHKRHVAERLLKESEERLRAVTDAQRKEIEHIMRVAVVGELSGIIAHELGQPLSSILLDANTAQTLLDRQFHDKTIMAEILDNIIEQDLRAGEVIKRLRLLLKKGEHRPGRVSLNELIISTLELLNSEFVTKRIQVETSLIDDLPAVWGDPIQLQQVLLNLIMNGVEELVSLQAPQRRLIIRTRIGGNGLAEVAISNRGRSLSPQELKLIFQPYFTTKERGLGLGLSICSRIVASHAGSLTLSNDNGGGVTAVISLPLSARMEAA